MLEEVPALVSGMAGPMLWSSWNTSLLISAGIGALLLMLRARWSAWLLLTGLLVYFLFATQAPGLERFRVPVLGLQAVVVGSVCGRPREDVELDASLGLAVPPRRRAA